MLKRDYTARVIYIILVLFSLFVILSMIYFFSAGRTRIDSVNILINSLKGVSGTFEQLSSGISGFYFLFIVQLTVFAAAAISLLSGLWYITHLYLVNKRDALIDHLTEVYNKRAILFALQRETDRAMRYKHSMSVAVLDIDFFKIYNDTNGHVAGDNLLRRFAGILVKTVRDYDYVGRFGGEEFLIIFPETKLKEAAKICERIRKNVQNTKFEGKELLPYKDVTVSIGVHEFSGSDISSNNIIIEKADKSLYEAKKSGRNAVVFDGKPMTKPTILS